MEPLEPSRCAQFALRAAGGHSALLLSFSPWGARGEDLRQGEWLPLRTLAGPWRGRKDANAASLCLNDPGSFTLVPHYHTHAGRGHAAGQNHAPVFSLGSALPGPLARLTLSQGSLSSRNLTPDVHARNKPRRTPFLLGCFSCR